MPVVTEVHPQGANGNIISAKWATKNGIVMRVKTVSGDECVVALNQHEIRLLAALSWRVIRRGGVNENLTDPVAVAD